MEFYTYMWLREDGTPYYAGKGQRYRAFKKDSHRQTPPPKDRILIQEFPNEAEAFEAEKFLIAFYGRKDLGTGCLRNLTDGGDNPPSQKGRTSKRKGKTFQWWYNPSTEKSKQINTAEVPVFQTQGWHRGRYRSASKRCTGSCARILPRSEFFKCGRFITGKCKRCYPRWMTEQVKLHPEWGRNTKRKQQRIAQKMSI